MVQTHRADAVHTADGDVLMVGTYGSGICWGAFSMLHTLSFLHLYSMDGHNERFNQNELSGV